MLAKSLTVNETRKKRWNMDGHLRQGMLSSGDEFVSSNRLMEIVRWGEDKAREEGDHTCPYTTAKKPRANV